MLGKGGKMLHSSLFIHITQYVCCDLPSTFDEPYGANPPPPLYFNCMKNVREIALDILCRVEAGAYADRLLRAHRDAPGLGHSDAGLLQELVRGTLVWQGALDHLLRPYLRHPLSRLPPQVRNLLRLGAYQLCYLDRVPAYATVSEAVDLARRVSGEGIARLVNAVLRGISEGRRPAPGPDAQADPVGALALSTSHPRWMVRRWVRRFGLEEARKLCEANNARPLLSLRANRLRTTPEALRAGLAAEGVEAEFSPLIGGYLTVLEVGPLFRTDAFRKGLFSVQGQGAGLVVRLLDPQPGERVLDLCSAPGGKATAAAERMGGRGLVLALDRHTGRLRTLCQNLRRLGVEGVCAAAADGRCPPTQAAFHRVLVDAPCSALGVLSRRAEVRWRRQESDLHALAVLQGQLLSAAAERVRAGGVLVYSTCSLEPEENEGVVEAFLSRRRDFQIEPAPDFLDAALAGPYLLALPHRHGCDGAFAARLRRVDLFGGESA